MDLAERAPPEMQVRQLQRGRLLRPQARVIQRPVQRVIPPGRAELARGGDPSRKNSKNSASRSGDGGAVADAGSQATCRAALNSSSGLSSRTPNTASISLAFRAVRNSWKPLNACK